MCFDEPLLTRDEFREAVFARDGYKCVVCGARENGLDAHHIIDRKLFYNGGYYLSNGVSLCSPCHIKAEDPNAVREFLPFALRERAGITEIILPDKLDSKCGNNYDKWGNYISTLMVKYPHTPHVPWSPGYDAQEDMVLTTTDHWAGVEVVITEKMDGEGTTMYQDNYHARSCTYKPHTSRSRARAVWGRIRYDIPFGWRICGENVAAEHSIPYIDLPGYFLVFSIWQESDVCLSWDQTELWCGLLELPTVPVLWRGTWDEAKCRDIIDHLDLKKQEGIVIRPAAEFRLDQIADPVSGVMGKWVRRGHVTTDEHWMDKPVVWNKLKGE